MTCKNQSGILFFGLFLSLSQFSQPVQAQSLKDQFIDTLDQKVDFRLEAGFLGRTTFMLNANCSKLFLRFCNYSIKYY